MTLAQHKWNISLSFPGVFHIILSLSYIINLSRVFFRSVLVIFSLSSVTLLFLKKSIFPFMILSYGTKFHLLIVPTRLTLWSSQSQMPPMIEINTIE